MENKFIPSFHFMPSEKKLTKEFFNEAINYLWHNTNLKSLLSGKNIEEIERYASGDIDMSEFKKMYKSYTRDFKKAHPDLVNNNTNNAEQDMAFISYPAIAPKLNSVTALVQKIPFEVSCTAQDGLAFDKKEEDITFIKNKPKIQADLQELEDQLQLGKIDLGTTKYSSVPFSDSPYGMDLAQPEELNVFADLIYKLGVEASYETILQIFYDLKNAKQIKLQEIKDQFKFGVSVNKCYQSSMTGLPEIEYVYPNNVLTNHSDLPDYSDNQARFYPQRVTPIELMNLFTNEICSESDLFEIVNGANDFGYCSCNGIKSVSQDLFNQFKMELVLCEIKSVDGIGVVSNPKKSKYSYMTDMDDPKCTSKIVAQNTYCAYWLKNTKLFFGIHKLGYATRTKGQESYQNFSTNIYRSQKVSAVEQCIGENKKAQIASIKLMYALIMSLPAGKYVDIKFLKGAVEDLKDSFGDNVVEQLIDLVFEKNLMLGSSEDFDDKPNAGNFRPFMDIAGGLKTEMIGYLQILQSADAKISQFTGANDQLTGQSANPEGLVGLQKLLINGSINALYYINEGIETQYQKVFNIWAWVIKKAVEDGGKTREAIVNMIGAQKVNIIDHLDEIPLHTMGVKFSIFQREEERARIEQRIMKLEQTGVLSMADLYMLDAVQNPKDKSALAAVKEMQFRKRYDAEQQQRIAAQQEAIRMQGENQVASENAKAEGKIKNTYAQGTVNANLQQVIAQSGMSAMQVEGLIKQQLQKERNDAQLDKSIKTLEVKANLKNQEV